jgi:hypothetical protein
MEKIKCVCLSVAGQKNKKVKRIKFEILLFFSESFYLVKTRVADTENVWRGGHPTKNRNFIFLL